MLESCLSCIDAFICVCESETNIMSSTAPHSSVLDQSNEKNYLKKVEQSCEKEGMSARVGNGHKNRSG